MTLIPRIYDNQIINLVKPGKVLLLYGARRIGKTTLLENFLKTYNGKFLLSSGEDRDLQKILETESVQQFKTFFGSYDLLIIDEAQKIDNIGIALKLIVDHISNISVIASVSSSFELSTKIVAPLTGRHRTRTLYPLSIMELIDQNGAMDINSKLQELLVYGMYPEVLTSTLLDEKKEYLHTLRDSYIMKDIFELEQLKNPGKLHDLLSLLAFQIGKEVSLNELSRSLGIAKQTVDRYLNILEKAFIIIKVRGFSRNLRKEITKNNRYYFLDNGIRNSIINNYNPISLRNDVGALWENFLFTERLKRNAYCSVFSNSFFWRTYDQKEMDLIEERDGKIYGFEFKWNSKKGSVPKQFTNTYPNAISEIITPDNWLHFVTQ